MTNAQMIAVMHINAHFIKSKSVFIVFSLILFKNLCLDISSPSCQEKIIAICRKNKFISLFLATRGASRGMLPLSCRLVDGYEFAFFTPDFTPFFFLLFLFKPPVLPFFLGNHFHIPIWIPVNVFISGKPRMRT